MTERERLLELLQGILYDYDLDHKAESIADALLSEGVVVPPCKVGDTVWIAGEVRGVYSSKVRTFFLTENGVEMVRTQHCDIPFGNIGKKAFVGKGAKEEAEKALERSKQ